MTPSYAKAFNVVVFTRIDKDGKRATATLRIDEQALAQLMARAASGNKSRKSKLAGGLIVLELTP